MLPALLLAPFLASQPSLGPVPALQPRLHVRFQPAPRKPQLPAEIVCGMPMIRKTPADDPKILLPTRETGAVIRRIQPPGCAATETDSGKK